MLPVKSVLMYEAEVCADVLNKKIDQIRLVRIQSQDAHRVVAGVVPVKPFSGEKKVIFHGQVKIGKGVATCEERTHTYQQREVVD